MNRSIWYISKSGRYFESSAEHYQSIRSSLGNTVDDPDRVALFMIRYNFLWNYRQFISKLVSSQITPYQNQKIANVLYVYSNTVQKAFNKIVYKFNNKKIYSGPVDDVTKLMNGMFNDLLV